MKKIKTLLNNFTRLEDSYSPKNEDFDSEYLLRYMEIFKDDLFLKYREIFSAEWKMKLKISFILMYKLYLETNDIRIFNMLHKNKRNIKKLRIYHKKDELNDLIANSLKA